MRIAACDGAKGGWVCAWGDVAGPKRLFAVTRLEELASEADLFALDIPIGLPDSGRRTCDLLVRDLLPKEKRNSLFPVCARPIMEAESYTEACAWARQLGEPCPSLQLFNLRSKIIEAEAFALQNPGRVVEVFPEWSFALMSPEASLAPKKQREGREQRERLLRHAFSHLPDFEPAPGVTPGPDDRLDALAAFWSARRLALGEAMALPTEEERDVKGLLMRIHG